MPRGGHNRKPTAIKKLEGNPGRRTLNEYEPQPQAGEPPKPSGLGKIASEEWDRLAPSLVAMGVLTEVDGATFAAYCTCFERVTTIREQIQKTPEPLFIKYWQDSSGAEHQEPKPNPLYAMEDRALKTLGAYAAQFGLSAATRSKIVVSPSSAPRSDSWAA